MAFEQAALFLPATPGQRFALHYRPAGTAPLGLVVHVPAWAEEMNKARRMVSMQARALADAGYAVLNLDLYGCGDSSGEFSEARWEDWLSDVVQAAQWLRAQYGAAPLWLWGLRAGALLASQAASALGPCNFLFWQPAGAGKPLLQQFLRLKLAADMQQGIKTTTEGLRVALQAGDTVNVAGYALPPGLALGLERATLEAPATPARVVWLEVSGRDEATLLPASVQQIQKWQAAGHAVQSQVVRGPSFWQTQELEDAPDLIEATLRGLAGASAQPAHD